MGQRLPRVDAKAKVRGEALYTLDMRLPGMLCGKVLTEPSPARAHRQYRHQAGRAAAGRQKAW